MGSARADSFSHTRHPVTRSAPKASVVASGMALEEGMLRLRGILAPTGQ